MRTNAFAIEQNAQRGLAPAPSRHDTPAALGTGASQHDARAVHAASASRAASSVAHNPGTSPRTLASSKNTASKLDTIRSHALCRKCSMKNSYQCTWSPNAANRSELYPATARVSTNLLSHTITFRPSIAQCRCRIIQTSPYNEPGVCQAISHAYFRARRPA